MNKNALRQEAIKIARTMLAHEDDYQEVGSTILNESRFEPLFEGKDEDESFDYVNGIIRMAEHQLGFSR